MGVLVARIGNGLHGQIHRIRAPARTHGLRPAGALRPCSHGGRLRSPVRPRCGRRSTSCFPASAGVAATMFTISLTFARKIYLCLMVGTLLVRDNTVHRIASALAKLRVPQTVLIPLTVTMRYFPTLREEAAHIRDAMALRDIPPASRLECFAVPLVMSATSTAEELSRAATCRGIENPVPVHGHGGGSPCARRTGRFSQRRQWRLSRLPCGEVPPDEESFPCAPKGARRARREARERLLRGGRGQEDPGRSRP